MIDVITIDPGVWALGWCAGSARRVVLAGCSKHPKDTRKPDLGALVGAHAGLIRLALLSNGLGEIDHRAAVYVEGMELRPSDPVYKVRDLCDVQAVGAGVGGRLGGALSIVPVSTWKGNVPKSVHHPRILAALDPNERRIVDAACKAAGKTNAKEVLDAVGIFLHSVRRIDKSGAPRT